MSLHFAGERVKENPQEEQALASYMPNHGEP